MTTLALSETLIPCLPALGEAFAPTHPVMRACAWWPAQVPREGWVVALLRLRFSLAEPIPMPMLWTTASQRFELWLDGRRVARGPARSDPRRWNVPRLALPELDAGEHVLAARVWHGGPFAGKAQLGGPAFWLLTSDDPALRSALERAGPWRGVPDKSREPQPRRAGPGRGHTAVGAGEAFDAAQHPWGWCVPGYDDAAWPEAKVVCRQAANPWGNLPLGHALRPEPIPPMQEASAAFVRVWVGEPLTEAMPGERFTLGAGRTQHWVFDRGEVTNAYPTVRWQGGRGATIRVITCEAPVDPTTRDKGRRDRIAGQALPGMADVIACDGGIDRAWEPLWFRSFRYLVLEVTTADEPITLSTPELVSTGYPLRRRAELTRPRHDDRPWDRLAQVSERTARLCSHETFFDCPHYEQAQFPGDGRILARYHARVFDEDRLTRKAIDDLHAGRTHSGLLRSHYPCRMEQVISTYSLAWIGMLYDHFTDRQDAAFTGRYLPAARAVVQWFERGRRADGLVGLCEAPFVDWAAGFEAGNSPQADDGGSAIVTCQLAEAAEWLVELEAAAGVADWAGHWRGLAASLRAAVMEACWDEAAGLLADTPGRTSYSVHAQVQAALAGVRVGEAATRAIRCALADADNRGIVQPGTFYYRYFVAEALRQHGDSDGARALLNDWFAVLETTGLTTWPESSRDNPRSDCHGWSVGAELIAHALAADQSVTTQR